MSAKKEAKPQDLFGRLKSYFITGLFILAPTMVTLWVALKAFHLFDGILGRFYTAFVFKPLELTTPPGIGALTLIIVVILVGMAGRSFFGKRLIHIWDTAITYVPMINRIYLAVRQIANTLKDGGEILFKEPVMVEFPRAGMYSIGFITRYSQPASLTMPKPDLYSVFIPTTPNPTTGFLVYLPQEQIHHVSLTVEDAMKLIISAGALSFDTVNPWESDDIVDAVEPKTPDCAPIPPSQTE